MTDNSIRLLVIDDDRAHVELLSAYLVADGFKVDCASDGEEGVAAALQGEHDALILDVMMPGMSGIEALRAIRRESQVPVLMLTAKGDDVDRVVGLELGADDYLAKPFLPRELVARIRAVLRRHHLSPAQAGSSSFTNGRVSIDVGKRECTLAGKPVDLTATEFNLLAALMRSVDLVLTKDELSVLTLDRKWAAYDRSIDVHINNLRHKLTAAGCAAHGIETVRGIGYKMAANP